MERGFFEALSGTRMRQSPSCHTIVKWIAWIVFALAVIGVLVTAGAMMINNRRGQGGEHAASLGWVFGGCILASAASGLVGMFMG